MQKEILENWLRMIAEDYKANMDAKGLTASGNTKSKTKVVMREDGGSIEVPLYNKALVQGRRPNTKQDPESLRKWVGWAGSTFLADWVQDKGLPSGIAYAVAWKIAKEGWKVPNANKSGRNFNDGTLIADTITPEKKTTLFKSLGENYTTEIKLTINEIWQ